MSIVIIDDNVTNLVVLKHIAKDHADRQIVSFTDSGKAREYLSVYAADLIIVDCEMPGLNGIDFTLAVRADRHHQNTPIIMVTSHKEDSLRQRAIRAGVSVFLTKPVHPDEFRTRIKNLLQLSPRRPVADLHPH